MAANIVMTNAAASGTAPITEGSGYRLGECAARLTPPSPLRMTSPEPDLQGRRIVKLYDSIGPNPRVVRMAIAEKAMVIDTVKVDLLAGENRQPAYLAKVPNGGLPGLELGNGRMISEITAIAEYLEDVQPSPAIIGTTPEERAETRMWTRRIDLAIVEPMTTAFRAVEGRQLFASRMSLIGAEGSAELKAMAQEKLLWLDGQMTGRTWICGDRHSLADMMLLAFVEFGATVGQPLPADAGWLAAWQKRAAARPSAAA
jgi:glutathione S-transferase